jgi:hypothetical protein
MKSLSVASLTLTITASLFSKSWNIKSQTEWEKNILLSEGIIIEEGLISPKGKAGSLQNQAKEIQSEEISSISYHSPVPCLAKLGRSPWRWPI